MERIRVAEATEEQAGRQVKAEIAQISGCSEKRRGASAKRSLGEDHKEK